MGVSILDKSSLEHGLNRDETGFSFLNESILDKSSLELGLNREEPVFSLGASVLGLNREELLPRFDAVARMLESRSSLDD